MGRILFLCATICFLVAGCGTEQKQAALGRIGDEEAITREMAAKTIALAFYTAEELEEMEKTADFPDISQEDAVFPFINGAVSMKFFSGDEDGNFYPENDLTLMQAKALVDRLAPDMENQIVLTEENQNLPVSYSLWLQLWEQALCERRGEESLDSYNIEQVEAVLLQIDREACIFDTGRYQAAGLDLQPYLGEKIKFWAKDGEILALCEVTEEKGTAENLYCQSAGGKINVNTGTDTVSFSYLGETVDGICDVTFEKGTVAEVKPAKSIGFQTVKRVNGQEIYLAEQGLLSWEEGYGIYDARGETIERKSVSALICGMAEGEFFLKDGKVSGAVLSKKEEPKNIRVLVGGRGQERIVLSAEGGFTLSSSQTQKEFMGQTQLSQEMPWFDYGIVRAEGKNGAAMNVAFQDGSTRSYYGVLELERRQDGIVLINELPMEEYLKGVVPHEMPVSFGETALEAQAITARSYAYNAVFANGLCGYGAHVDDTVSSQVYLGADTDPLSDEAVEKTEGLCLTVGNAVITAYFYSTSCGYGASAKDVWQSEGEEKEYLTGGIHGVTGEMPKTEEEWLAFWQDWEKEAYDMDSPWYRWKVYFGAGQISEIAAAKLEEAAKTNAKNIEVQQKDGTWKAQTPKDLGMLKGISVEERGDGGVVKTLLMEFEGENVRIKGEYNIRKVLSPKRMTYGETIYLQRKDGASLTDTQLLPSGFFAVKQMRNDSGALTGVALYGGGNGHGVGMSQYGAKYLAEQGKDAAEILELYYPGSKVAKVYEIDA